jgi:hypothetical protein
VVATGGREAKWRIGCEKWRKEIWCVRVETVSKRISIRAIEKCYFHMSKIYKRD